MRVLCILLLSIISLTTANHFNFGHRRKGDFLLEKGTVSKLPLPLTRRKYTLKAGVDSVIINAIEVVEVTNDPESMVRVLIVEGGIGSSKVQMIIKGQRGRGINVDYNIYAYTSRLLEDDVQPSEFMGNLIDPDDDDFPPSIDNTNNKFY